MAETMYDEPASGSPRHRSRRQAAGRHDLDWTDEGERNPRVLLNPEIVRTEGTTVSEGEGWPVGARLQVRRGARGRA